MQQNQKGLISKISPGEKNFTKVRRFTKFPLHFRLEEELDLCVCMCMCMCVCVCACVRVWDDMNLVETFT